MAVCQIRILLMTEFTLRLLYCRREPHDDHNSTINPLVFPVEKGAKEDEFKMERPLQLKSSRNSLDKAIILSLFLIGVLLTIVELH